MFPKILSRLVAHVCPCMYIYMYVYIQRLRCSVCSDRLRRLGQPWKPESFVVFGCCCCCCCCQICFFARACVALPIQLVDCLLYTYLSLYSIYGLCSTCNQPQCPIIPLSLQISALLLRPLRVIAVSWAFCKVSPCCKHANPRLASYSSWRLINLFPVFLFCSKTVAAPTLASYICVQSLSMSLIALLCCVLVFHSFSSLSLSLCVLWQQ